MKIVHIVNVADAQSIPLELAVAIQKQPPHSIVAGYYARGDHPADTADGSVISLGADKALDFKAVRRLRTLLRQERPDIVHVHHAVSAFWVALLVLFSLHRPILIKTEHNDHRFLPGHQLAINALLYPFLKRIVCNSDTTLASFTALEKRLSGDRGLRIYNGVDIARVRRHAPPATTPDTAPSPDAPVLIGSIGRLVPQKNQHRLIAGLAAARATSGRDIRLDIVGNGPLLADLQKTAADHGVTEAVTFSGALARDDVYAKLAGWHGFVMASNFEGFCNALVEAMAAGLPVAVSDIDTLREVGGPDAVRFDHTQPEAIGQALVALGAQPRTDGSFADRYDISVAVARHMDLYQTVYGQPEDAPSKVRTT